MTPIDVLYIVRPGDRNEELRYSLRSLANIPHGRVWLVGHRSAWVTNVEFVPGNRHLSKWRNVYDNLRIACERVAADRFIVMNDDFFITRRCRTIPRWHRGLLSDHIQMLSSGPWRFSLELTRKFLIEHGIAEPLSYELHVPVVMEREKLGAVLEMARPKSPWPPQWRTLYGNWWKVPSKPAPDVRIRKPRDEYVDGGFLSTDDWTFRAVQPYLAALLPQAGPYEAMQVAA
jgi:hypothetical protein